MLHLHKDWKLITGPILRCVNILPLIWPPNSNYTKLPCLPEVISRNQYLCVKLKTVPHWDFRNNFSWPALYLAIMPFKQNLQHCYFKSTSFLLPQHILNKEAENTVENTTKFKTAQREAITLFYQGFTRSTMPKP